MAASKIPSGPSRSAIMCGFAVGRFTGSKPSSLNSCPASNASPCSWIFWAANPPSASKHVRSCARFRAADFFVPSRNFFALGSAMRDRILLMFAMAFLATNVSGAAFPDVKDLPVQPDLPDPLVMFDGTWLTTAKQWKEKRRPELAALFQHYMYGQLPPKPEKITFKVQAEHDDFLDGKATLKLVTINFGSEDTPQIDLMLVLPK